MLSSVFTNCSLILLCFNSYIRYGPLYPALTFALTLRNRCTFLVDIFTWLSVLHSLKLILHFSSFPLLPLKNGFISSSSVTVNGITFSHLLKRENWELTKDSVASCPCSACVKSRKTWPSGHTEFLFVKQSSGWIFSLHLPPSGCPCSEHDMHN